VTIPNTTGDNGVDDKVDAELEDAEGVEDGEPGGVPDDAVHLHHDGDAYDERQGETGDCIGGNHDSDQLSSPYSPLTELAPSNKCEC